MTLAEAAPSPLNLASWNLCVLGVAVAGDTMHAEFVPMSQCRHLAIVACVDSLCAIRTEQILWSSSGIAQVLVALFSFIARSVKAILSSCLIVSMGRYFSGL